MCWWCRFRLQFDTMWTGFFLVVLLQCCRSDNCETLTKVFNIHFQISLVFSGSSPVFFTCFGDFFGGGRDSSECRDLNSVHSAVEENTGKYKEHLRTEKEQVGTRIPSLHNIFFSQRCWEVELVPQQNPSQRLCPYLVVTRTRPSTQQPIRISLI